jgi:hypothetical protein
MPVKTIVYKDCAIVVVDRIQTFGWQCKAFQGRLCTHHQKFSPAFNNKLLWQTVSGVVTG